VKKSEPTQPTIGKKGGKVSDLFCVLVLERIFKK